MQCLGSVCLLTLFVLYDLYVFVVLTIIEIQETFCENDTAITGVPVLPLLALTAIGNARHIKPREHLLKGKAQYCLSPH